MRLLLALLLSMLPFVGLAAPEEADWGVVDEEPHVRRITEEESLRLWPDAPWNRILALRNGVDRKTGYAIGDPCPQYSEELSFYQGLLRRNAARVEITPSGESWPTTGMYQVYFDVKNRGAEMLSVVNIEAFLLTPAGTKFASGSGSVFDLEAGALKTATVTFYIDTMPPGTHLEYQHTTL